MLMYSKLFVSSYRIWYNFSSMALLRYLFSLFKEPKEPNFLFNLNGQSYSYAIKTFLSSKTLFTFIFWYLNQSLRLFCNFHHFFKNNICQLHWVHLQYLFYFQVHLLHDWCWYCTLSTESTNNKLRYHNDTVL